MARNTDKPREDAFTPRVERAIVLHEVSEDQMHWRPYDCDTDGEAEALFERITIGPVMH